MKVLWELEPLRASPDASRIQIFTAFQSFATVDPDSSDDLDFPDCQNLPETKDFWCKLLGNELFVHSKHGFGRFVGRSNTCDFSDKGPVYDKILVLESKAKIVELMKIASILNSIRGGIYFTEHIAFCWPHCKHFMNGDACPQQMLPKLPEDTWVQIKACGIIHSQALKSELIRTPFQG